MSSETEEELTDRILEEILEKNSEIVEETSVFKDVQPVSENNENVEEPPFLEDDEPGSEDNANLAEPPVVKNEKPIVGREKKLLSDIVKNARQTVQDVVDEVLDPNRAPKGKTDDELIAEHFNDNDLTNTDEVYEDTEDKNMRLEDNTQEFTQDSTNSDIVSIDGFADIDEFHSNLDFTDKIDEITDERTTAENEAAKNLENLVESKNAGVNFVSFDDKAHILNTDITDDVSIKG